MKNAYIEHLFSELRSGKKISPGQLDLANAYAGSIQKGFEVIMFSSTPREKSIESLVDALRAANITEIYITSDASNNLDRFLMLDDLGLKLRGITRLDNAKYKQDIAKYGESWERPFTPAIKFSFEV